MLKKDKYIVIQTGTDAEGNPATRRTRIKAAPSPEGAAFQASQKKRRLFTPQTTKAYKPERAPTLEQWLQYQSLINLAALARATWPDKSPGTAKARLHNHLTGEKPMGSEQWQQVIDTLRKFLKELQTKI